MKTQRTIAMLLAVGLVLAAAGTAGEAQAALTTGMSAAAPTTDVVISQTAGANAVAFRYNRPAGTDRNPRDQGQTFLSPGFTLDKVTVNVSALATSAYDSQPVTLAIQTFSSGSDFTPDSTVVTESGTLPSTMKSSFNGGSTYLTFDITDVALSAGQQYGFLLMHDGPQASGDNMLLAAQSNSGYTDGIGVRREYRGTGSDNYAETTVWTGSSQPADLEFYVQEAAGGPPPPPPPSTLKHHYTFDADATDSAGSTDGTFVGNASVNVGGNPVGGGYLDLDGNGDWVSFGANQLTPAGSTASNELTISGWVRFDGATKVNPYDTRNLGSFYAESSGGNVRYNFDGRADQNNGQMALDQFPGSGGSWFGASNTGFADWQWHHIAYVQDTSGTLRQFFIDGMPFATSGTPENYSGGTSFDVAIGARTGANGKEPDAGLDDMAFWHEALSIGEMKGLYDVALDPTLGYDAGQFDLLKRVFDQTIDSATIGALAWTRATGLSGQAGLSGSGSEFTLVLDAGQGTGVISRSAGDIPEPATMLLLGLGIGGVAMRLRRRRRA